MASNQEGRQMDVDECIEVAETGADGKPPVRADSVPPVEPDRRMIGCPLCHRSHIAHKYGEVNVVGCPEMKVGTVLMTPTLMQRLDAVDGELAEVAPEAEPALGNGRRLTADQVVAAKLRGRGK